MDFPITKFPHLTTLEASLKVEYPEKVFGEIKGLYLTICCTKNSVFVELIKRL